MGFFSKLRCEACGKESRLFMNKFSDGYSERLLCDDCLSKIHAKGFVEHQQKMVSGKVEFKKLYQYKDYYNSVVNNENYRYDLSNVKELATEHLDLLVFELPGLRINKNFITISGREDLIVETKDVFAITITPVAKFSGPLLGYNKITFFTNNPLVPYFATVYDGKTAMFLNKRKEFKRALNDALTGYCRNLRYGIVSSDELGKILKHDVNYSAAIPKNNLESLLTESMLNIGAFDAEDLYNSTLIDDGWDEQLHTDMGYLVVR